MFDGPGRRTRDRSPRRARRQQTNWKDETMTKTEGIASTRRHMAMVEAEIARRADGAA